jgi:hypothetical protein
MKKRNIMDIVTQADAFLLRMKEVDIDSFVDRFGATVGTVKESLACS